MKWIQNLVDKTSGFLDSYALSLNDPCSDSREDKLISPPGDSSPSPKATSRSFPELPEVQPGDPSEEVPDASDLLNPPILSENDSTSRNTLHQSAVLSASPKNWSSQQPVAHEPYNTQAQYSHANMTVLKDMLKHVIPGARHNSAARDPPPRCHPGTRTRILQDMNARIHDRNTRMVWLFGPAGSGKSAIMQTIAETQPPHVIYTTLFLSQTNGRDDPNKVLTSLAYGFAVINPAYRHFCEEMMILDPDFLSLSMDEQFKRLFVQPFITLATQGAQRWVVILDGLDECRSEAAQGKLVGLIQDSIAHQSTPLLWIISSRPELHLKASFSEVRECISGFWEQEISVDSRCASEDVSLYLRAEFARIRKVHGYSIPSSSSWPSDDELFDLSKASSGFFSFASAATEYIASANPVSHLHDILSSNCPLESIDSMYIRIMSNIPSDVLPTAKTILGFYVLQRKIPHIYPSSPTDIENLGFLTLCNILGINQHDAYAALHKLSSLLVIPPPEEAKDSGIRFCHPSFLQFLSSSSRSASHCINLQNELQKVWRRYLQILQQAKESKSHNHIYISWQPNDETSTSRLQSSLLHIVRRGWTSILVNCCGDSYHESSCPKLVHMHLGSHEIINLFKELGPIALDCAELEIGQFIKWVTKDVVYNVKKMIIRGEMYTDTFDTGKLLKNIYANRLCRRVVSSSTTGVSITSTVFGVAQEPKMTGQTETVGGPGGPSNTLGELIEACASTGPRIPVIIISACDNSGRRAVIGPIAAQDPSGDVYYIVPYE